MPSSPHTHPNIPQEPTPFSFRLGGAPTITVDYGVEYKEVRRGTAVFQTAAQMSHPTKVPTTTFTLGENTQQIAPSSVGLDFAGVPVAIDSKAITLLSELPWRAFSPVLRAIQRWVSSAPVRRIAVTVATDPEAPGWTQVVFSMLLDATADQALRMWDELARNVDAAKADAEPNERRILDRQLSLHLDWQ